MWASLFLGFIFVFSFDEMSIKGFVLAIISGAITSGLGYVLWYTVLPSLKTTIAAVLQLTVPIIAAIVGVLFFSEELTMELVFAAILVAMGTFVSLINKPSQ